MTPETQTSIQALTSADFDSIALGGHDLVVVDFWAPWCIYCKKLAPIYDELSKKMAGQLRFTKVNADEAPELTKRYGISGLPTLKFFCNGREVGEIIGAPPRERLEAAFREAVASARECLAVSSPTK